MSILSIDERRKVAERLRGPFDVVVDNGYFNLNGTIFGMGVYANTEDRLRIGMLRFAEFIDPAPWERTVEDNHRLLDRCRELERENAALKHRIGRTDAHGLSLARPYLLRIARDLEREGLDGRAVTVDVGGYAERIREAVGSDAD